MTTSGPVGTDLVPLAERLRYLRVLRVLIVAGVVAGTFLLPGSPVDPRSWLWLGSAGYLAAALAAEGGWRLARRRGRWIFGLLITLDGVYLAWATYETGGTQSPVRYLVLVHLGAVALLSSYRAVLKLALWDSLLALVVDYARRAGPLAAVPGGPAGASLEYRRVVLFVAALWLLTLVIATLSAANQRELRRRRVDFEALAGMGHALEDADTVVAVSNVLADSLVATFGFPRVAVFDAAERHFRLLTCRGMLDALVSDLSVDSESVLVRAGVGRTTVRVAGFDAERDPWLASAMPGAANLLVIPLVAEGRTVAVVVAETGLRARSRIGRRVETTERFAAHAALALRNAALHERMLEMAATDGLTSLANRRSLDEALARDISRAERTEGRLSLVLLDLDHFKALNDTHGHLVGDNVLRAVAATLREFGREYDTVARYGGEEFAVVLPGCSATVARHVAERLRAAVESAETEVPVTVSCGVATYPADGTDAKALIQAADVGLYASKRAGRNRVTAAGQARTPAAS